MTRKRLLIVDDEFMVRRALARMLGRDYEVTTLPSADEALARLSSGDCWDAILSDVMMPGMDGVEFAARAVELAPHLVGRIILMTGNLSALDGSAPRAAREVPVIGKPMDVTALRALLGARCSVGQ